MHVGQARERLLQLVSPGAHSISPNHKIRPIFSPDFTLFHKRWEKPISREQSPLIPQSSHKPSSPRLHALQPPATGQFEMSSHAPGPAPQWVHLTLGPVHPTCSHLRCPPPLPRPCSVANCHLGQLESPARTNTQALGSPCWLTAKALPSFFVVHF